MQHEYAGAYSAGGKSPFRMALPEKTLLSVQDITHSYGAQPVLRGVSLTIHQGDRVGLIGRNGSGKSTLMRIMAGALTPDAGLVTRAQDTRAALLEQRYGLALEKTVGAVLLDAGAEVRSMRQVYREMTEQLGQTPGECWEHRRLQEECEHVQHALDIADGWAWEQEVKRISVALDLPEQDRVLGTLSGGELRRVDLATKLLRKPDVLLLDEPTNHIDTRSVAWIEEFLENYRGSCVLVTHDRYFLDRVVNRIAELEFNQVYSFPGSYERFLEYKAQVEETEARTEANRRAFIRRELAWFKRGPKARTTKQKARIQRLMQADEQGPPERHREFLFEIPVPERLGKDILEAKAVAHGYGGAPLFRDFSLIMQRGMCVGLVGPNGCGKTTLLRVLMGLEEPEKGAVRIGESTRFLYVDQRHEAIDPEQTVLDFVSEGAHRIDLNGRRLFVPAYLERFLFDKASAFMPMGNLSGGERNRLHLLKRLLKGGNFLVLDEPTNDLDLYTLRLLEETIEAFDGCALVVSHDRYFLNRICTHMLVFEEDGQVVQLAGNYDDYLLYRARRAQAEKARRANRPAREEAPASKPQPRKRRLTYREKMELEGMEARILEAEEEVARLEAAIQEPGFYEQDHAAVNRVLQRLEQARIATARLYDRWEELERVAGG